MEQNLASIEARGLGMAAISYDSPAVLAAFASREKIRPLLSDPDSAVIRRYGILNETVAANTRRTAFPTPERMCSTSAGS